ncbi:cytidine deaminase [Streptomyces spiroverticillatus]|uniref:Cytidine deaminase n=1 Tax=Streptomyces finlayi TaxID=67296 RepID=A0A918X3M5_9ACTN|nr:cytidine deaminase [Streptomyces finlayi]GGZ94824.1 cytidine deaminase [Streptomyces spiroverticillatus]GHD07156.1 cytidine deaminase [Streptomyces finlayi]
MPLDQELVDAALDQMNRRWPAGEPGGAAAVRLADGGILTSVGLDNMNGGVTLCQETGAFIQAYTQDRTVVASVCVCRDDELSRVLILPPCGICQERLALWGPGVEVAVPHPADPTRWEARTLAEVNPYYWGVQFAEGKWPSFAQHSE